MAFDYRISGGSWCPATVTQRSDTAPVGFLDASIEGVPHSLTWRASDDALLTSSDCPPIGLQRADFDSDGDEATDSSGVRWVDGVELRATPTDDSESQQVGAPVVSSSFDLGNDAPDVELLPFLSTPLSGDVGIEFRILDSSSDLASLEVQFRTDATAPWTDASTIGPRQHIASATPAEAASEPPLVLVWRTRDPTGGLGNVRATDVSIRLRAFDTVDGVDHYGPWTQRDALEVNNQTPPSIEGFALLNPLRDFMSGGLNFSYRVVDSETDVVDLAFDFSLDGGSTWSPCSEWPTLWSEGRYDLASADRTALPGGAFHQFSWDVAADLLIPGTNVIVRALAADDYGTGPEARLELRQTIGAGQLSQLEPGFVCSSLPSAIVPRDVELIDLTGDGRLDAVALEPTDRVRIWRGMTPLADGTPQFGAPEDLEVGSATGMGFGDFNEDTVQDIVIRSDSNLVQVYVWGGSAFVPLGTGPFSFGPSFTAVVSGDFNDDGHADIANADSSTMDIFLGDGAGGFTASAIDLTNGLPMGVHIHSVVADVSGDTIDDLVVLLQREELDADTGSSAAAIGSVEVFLGSSSGLGSPEVVRDDVAFYRDFDGNSQDWFRGANITTSPSLLGGGDEVIIAESLGFSGNRVRIQSRDTGAWVETYAGTEIVSARTLTLSTFDFNGDGFLDLHPVSTAGEWSIDLTTGDGTASRATTLTGVGDDVAGGDINGDGLTDVFLAQGVRICMGSSTFGPSSNSYAPGGSTLNPAELPKGVLALERQGDGAVDIALVDQRGAVVSFRGQRASVGPLGNVDFETFLPPAGTFLAFSSAFGDFAGTGTLDLLSNEQNGGSASLSVGEGGTGSTPLSYLTAFSTSFGFGNIVDAADFNGDGLDTALAFESDFWSWLTFRSDGMPLEETGMVDLVNVGQANRYALGDFNGDGLPDLAVGGSGQMSWAFGQADAVNQLGGPCNTALVGTFRGLVAGDFDADGLDEVIAGVTTAAANMVLIDFAGCSATISPLQTGIPVALDEARAEDMNADGAPDIVARSGSQIRVWQSIATDGGARGAFYSPVVIALPSSTLVSFGDVDGDGVQDVVGADASSVYWGFGDRGAEPWHRRLNAADLVGWSIPASPDRLGRVRTLVMGSRRTLGRPPEPTQADDLRGDFTDALRRSGIVSPTDSPDLQPATAAWRFGTQYRAVLNTRGYRLEPRYAQVEGGLDLSAGRGVVVSLPVYRRFTNNDLSTGTVRVFARELDWLRSADVPGDPNNSSAAFLPTAPSGLPVTRRVESWVEIPEDSDGDLSTGSGPRFSTGAGEIQIVTDRLGDFRGYLMR